MSDNLLSIILREYSKKKEEKKEKDSKDKVSVTKHSLLVEGKPIPFTAETGYMPMKDDEDQLKCKIFYTAYIRDDVSDKSKRPITFAFNGGPGCASIWLHFGALGPKRAALTEEGDILPPPHRLEDNPHTWLSFTDLVFIDPVGTGYSRPAKEEDPKNFYGLNEDLASVGDFIRLYITKNKRWMSPKFLAGESYGTTRAAGLAGFLQTQRGIDLNGIILISSVLNFITMYQEVGNDLSFMLFLPSYTASAWYHKKLNSRLMENLNNTLKEVEDWAMSGYLLALAKGDALSLEEYEETAEKLAQYTGVSKDYVKYCNLRIPMHRYIKELLRDERRTVGRLDSRFKGIDLDSSGEIPEYDPSFTWAPFMSAIGEYIRVNLGYENDIPYAFLSEEANRSWKWMKEERGGMGYPNVGDILRHEMCRNKYLQVFVASGYYDLATPYFAADYTMSHLGLDPSLRSNITTAYYESGHMVYYNYPCLIQFTKDVCEFYKKSTSSER